MTPTSPMPRRIRDIMTRDVQTVAPSATVSAAYSLMLEGSFRHVVVVDGEKVVGMLSDRDILRRMPPPSVSSSAEQGRFASAQVSSMMSAPALSVGGDQPIETAVDMMLTQHISALVVTDAEHRLQGVVTLVDLARLCGWLIRSLPLPPSDA